MLGIIMYGNNIIVVEFMKWYQRCEKVFKKVA